MNQPLVTPSPSQRYQMRVRLYPLEPMRVSTRFGSVLSAETDAGSASTWSFDITQPLNASGHFAAAPIAFSGAIVPPAGHNDPIENVQVRWEEDGTTLHTGHDNESGRSSFNTTLAPGHHTIHAHVVDFDNTDNVLATASVNLYVCANGDLLDFSAAIDDAVWHTHIGDQNNTSSERGGMKMATSNFPTVSATTPRSLKRPANSARAICIWRSECPWDVAQNLKPPVLARKT